MFEPMYFLKSKNKWNRHKKITKSIPWTNQALFWARSTDDWKLFSLWWFHVSCGAYIGLFLGFAIFDISTVFDRIVDALDSMK